MQMRALLKNPMLYLKKFFFFFFGQAPGESGHPVLFLEIAYIFFISFFFPPHPQENSYKCENLRPGLENSKVVTCQF